MKKAISVCITFVLVAITAALGWVTYGYRDWDVKNWQETIGELKPQSRGEYDSNGAIKYEIANNNNLMLSFQKTLDAADNEAKRTIQATVYPETATNQQVDWSIAWKNPTGTFEQSNTVTDYAIVTPQTDGSLIATVTCLQGFRNHPIVVICITRDGFFSATCNLIFEGIPTEIDMYVNGIKSEVAHFGDTISFKNSNYWDDVIATNDYRFEVKIKNKIYERYVQRTYDENFNYTVNSPNIPSHQSPLIDWDAMDGLESLYPPAFNYDFWIQTYISEYLVSFSSKSLSIAGNSSEILNGLLEWAFPVGDPYNYPENGHNWLNIMETFEDGVIKKEEFPVIYSIEDVENFQLEIKVFSCNDSLSKTITLTADLTQPLTGVSVDPESIVY